MRISWIVLCLVAVIVTVHAKPTIYKRNEDNVFEPGEADYDRSAIELCAKEEIFSFLFFFSFFFESKQSNRYVFHRAPREIFSVSALKG